MKASLALVVAASTVLGIAGCAAEAAEPESAAPVSVGHAKAGRQFNNLEEMRAASDIVVLAKATDHTAVDHIGGLAFTTTEMEVLKVLRGTPGSSVKVRQTGSTTELNADDPLIRAGEVDLLCLERFVGPDGKPTDQYVTVGYWQGRYKQVGGKYTHAESEDNVSPLPNSVTSGDMDRLTGN